METFKVSDNRLLEIDGHWFLFLVDQGTIFEMEADAAETLHRCGGAGEFGKAQFIAHLSVPETDKEEFFQDLVDRQVLVATNGEIRRAVKPDARDTAIPLQTLVLHVTDACNLECLYCYRSKTTTRRDVSRVMSVRTARAAVDLLMKRSGPLKEVVLVFFGGEPFLNLDLITHAAEYARTQAKEKGKTISFAVTTNGTLLTPEVIECINEYQISVTVSIDGFETIHDRYRPFPNGVPSSPAILPRLEALLQQNGHKPTVARVTVAESPDAVPQILTHLLELGFSEVGFAPVTTRNPRYQLSSENMKVLLDRFKTLADDFLDHARRDGFLGFSNLIDLLVTLHEGEVKDYPCGAGLGLFSVDPDGRLYLCQRLTGEESYCMGDVFEGFDPERVAQFREQAMGKRRSECQSCWVRRICAGGCYHEALVREGGLTEPNRHYCRWIQRWIAIGLETYGKIALSRPEYLDKLSLVRGHTPIFTTMV